MAGDFNRSILALFAAGVACAGASADLLTPGFVENAGQFAEGVLFGFDSKSFFREGVELVSAGRLVLELAGANPATRPVGAQRRPFPLHYYAGPDPKKWREDLRHYSTVRYADVYPGIDIEWYIGEGQPALRITIAAGADPQSIRFRVQSSEGPPVLSSFSPDRLRVTLRNGSFDFENLEAFQIADGRKVLVRAEFVKLDESSFRPEPRNWDRSQPVTLEIGRASRANMNSQFAAERSDGATYFAGYLAFLPRPRLIGHVGSVSSDGQPRFLAVFDGSSPRVLTSPRNELLTVVTDALAEVTTHPVSVDAPRPTPALDEGGETWLGQFDAKTGRLRHATFTGGRVAAVSASETGEIYFATKNAVSRWTPGNSRFTFTSQIADVRALAATRDSVVFAAAGAPGLPTTRNAAKATYHGQWDMYAGALDGASGVRRMSTYVSVIGMTGGFLFPKPELSIAPNGTIWISTEVGLAHTLVALAEDGTRVVHSEAVPGKAHVAFDEAGNVLTAFAVEHPALPTAPDAQRRFGCAGLTPARNLYVRTSRADGSGMRETYLRPIYSIESFDGPNRLFYRPTWTTGDVERMDIRAVRPPEVHCVAHAANRQVFEVLTPGTLYTLVGNRLGPLDPVIANFSPGSTLPTQLGGVRVSMGDVALPLVSVQQGAIVFYLPPVLFSSGMMQVSVNGAPRAQFIVSLQGGQNLGLFSADGSGRGPVAAVNQDGTINSEGNPARLGSTISVFGTGTSPTFVGAGSFGPPLTVTYDGPAPGLVPGVRQINVRIPADLSQSLFEYGQLRLRILNGSLHQPPTWVFLAR